MSSTNLHSGISGKSTLVTSKPPGRISSFLKTVGFDRQTSHLPTDLSQKKETRSEKKERKRPEEEAKLTPQELALAGLMDRYGFGGGVAPAFKGSAERKKMGGGTY